MAVEIRETTAAAVELLDGVLRAGSSTLAPEYPLVFGERAPGRLVTVEEEGRPVAGLALLERTLQCGAVRLPVGLIGSVATDPAYRGRGHATAALAEAERALSAAGCAIALLWAEDAEFYASRGWVPIGTEVNHVIPLEAVPLLPEASSVRPARPDDAPALHALYCAHTTRVERNLVESRRLLATPNMTTLVLERGGEPCAYACEGRGEDLKGAIHEWAGAPVEVLAVVRAHLQRVGRPLVLMSPRDARGVFRYLTVLGIEAHVGVLGMGKLLSNEAAATALSAACPKLTVTSAQECIRMTGPAGTAELDARQTLLALAAPRGSRHVVAAVEELTGAALDKLPLAPFCWGLDSI
jgi:GNAT superfamily N-acetyltransferase